MTNEELKEKILSIVRGAMIEANELPFIEETEHIADTLIAAGYRKQSDVAEEFVKEVKALLNKYEYRSHTDGVSFYQMNAESFCDEIDELVAEFGAEVEK